MKARSPLAIYGEPLLVLVATVVFALALFFGWMIRATSDFHVFYQSAVDLHAGRDPYSTVLAWGMPNANAPALMVFLIPFGWLSREAAFIVWTALGIVAFGWCAWLVAKETGRSVGSILMVALSTQGVAVAVHSGQLTLLLTPIVTLAWMADRHDDERRAGMWIGTLFYLKPFFGLLAPYLLWKRRYRTLAFAIVTTALWFLAGVVMFGWTIQQSWVASLGHANHFEANMINASVRAIFARLFNPYYPDTTGHYTPIVNAPAMETWAWLCVSAVVLVVTAAAILRRRSRDAEWAMICLAALVVSPLGWIYYLPMLVGPLTAVWRPSFAIPALLGAVPAFWLLAQHFNVVGTLTIGSTYAWALLGLWALVVRQPVGKTPTVDLG